MADIVERLRDGMITLRFNDWDFVATNDLMTEAATEITRLRERVRELEGALRPFAEWAGHIMVTGSRPLADDEYPPSSGCPDFGDLRKAYDCLTSA